MKIRVLFAAASLVVMTSAAWSQSIPAPDGSVMVDQPKLERQLEPKQPAPTLLEEQGYIWAWHHFRQLDEEGRDTNRRNVVLPIKLVDTLEIRGFGQVFTPSVYWGWFQNITNDTTNMAWLPAYYEQFRDARDFTIDSIKAFFFKNPNSATQFAPVMFYVYGMPTGFNATTYFNGSAYKTQGFFAGRQQLPVVFETEISPDGLDTTINESFINPIHFAFDPPLAFTANNAAVMMFINDDGEALEQPVGGQGDVRDFQIFASFFERREGNHSGFQPWKAQGLTLWRNTNRMADSIYSMWRMLRYTNGDSAVYDNWLQVYGLVEIGPSGVKYQYGTAANEQGLGSPIPNPVSVDSRLPFSLTEVSDVAIDLYDVRGTHVREVLRARYIPGNYSVPLGAGDLANGSYVVRMVAGEKVYSMKFNVGL